MDWKITELFLARARFTNKFHQNTLWATTYVADNYFPIGTYIAVNNAVLNRWNAEILTEFPQQRDTLEYRLEFVFLTTINCYLLSSGGGDSFFLLCFILLEPACFYTQKWSGQYDPKAKIRGFLPISPRIWLIILPRIYCSAPMAW